jgi:FAD/FMN-containing dehydrogenase
MAVPRPRRRRAHAVNPEGIDMAITADRYEVLADDFAGVLIGPDDASFEEARRCHNGLVDKRPALIARCRGATDVVEALRFARAEGLEVAVRGGGHNVAGHAVSQDGIVIDLSLMRGVDIDPRDRTARVQGGALWSDVNREAALHGMAVTGGAISTTGVGGYTLGGGLGWLMGMCGLATDNLLEAEVVLASGEVVRAGPDDHPELFWALRGGGGNFGVVTSFVFRLHLVGEVLGGLVAHPFDAAGELLRFYRDFTTDVPDELTVFGGVVHAPDGSGMPLAALIACHAGPRDQAERDVGPLLEWGTPAQVDFGPMPYPVMNTLLDEEFPPGSLNYWKSTFTRGIDDELIDTIVERFPSSPSPWGGILFEHFHGAVTRVPPDATAVPHRAPGYNLLIPSVWRDPETTEENIAWTRDTFAAFEPFRAEGRWLNYYTHDEDDDALDAAYGPNRRRLVDIKRRYDPDNVFHLNQNISPA